MTDGRVRITEYPFLIGLMELNPVGIEFYRANSTSWTAYVLCDSLEQVDQLKTYALINNKEILPAPALNGTQAGKYTLKLEIK